MNARGDAHHVVQAPVVFRVTRKPEAKRVFDALRYFFPGAFLSCGNSYPLLELRPLGDKTLTELLSLGPQVEAAETMQGLVAACFQRPVSSAFPFCGVHRLYVGPWEEDMACGAIRLANLAMVVLNSLMKKAFLPLV